MKKIWSALLIICCLLSGAFVNAQASDGPSVVADARNSVAVVCVGFEDEETGFYPYGTGSCFFVGKSSEHPQYLVTNHHVIEFFLECGEGERGQLPLNDGRILTGRAKIRVYYDSIESGTFNEAYLVDYNEVQDIAVLRLDKATDRRKGLPLCQPEQSMVGTQVYAIGYPGLSEHEEISAVESWSAEDATVTTGTISRLLTQSGTGVPMIQTDTDIKHGNSGGPLINQNGSVLGICTRGLPGSEDDGRLLYAVSIAEVLPMLDKNNIVYDLEPETDSGITGGEPVTGGGITEKGSSTDGTTIDEPSTDGGTTKDDAKDDAKEDAKDDAGNGSGSSKLLPVAAAGVAVVILILIIFIVSKKKKKTAAEPPIQSSFNNPGPTTPASYYKIQGVSGALEGQSYPIESTGTTVLGRNPSLCKIVFPADTAGVSGKHCELWVSGGKVYIRDVGSSHGTFLSSGRKLAANESAVLNAGDNFSLGSTHEMFVVMTK